MNLMQIDHEAYPLLRSRQVISIPILPAFFDMCSRALSEFISLAHTSNPQEMENSDMFSVMNEMIDTFQELLENDEPDEFFALKEHFEEDILPNFKSLMAHLSRCVDKPESLRQFYHSLALKIEQAYEYHILGDE